MYFEKCWQKIDLMNLPNIDSEIKNRTNALSPEWKILIRKGIPISQFKRVILHIFKKLWSDNELEYKSALSFQFPEGRIPVSFKNVPTLTHVELLENVLVVHFLNDEGIYVPSFQVIIDLIKIIGSKEIIMGSEGNRA